MKFALIGFEFFLCVALTVSCGPKPVPPPTSFDVQGEHISVHGELTPNSKLSVEQAQPAVKAGVDLLETK